MDLSDLEIVARTIYGEARGEYHNVTGGLAPLIAVANVIMNRFKYRGIYGQNLKEVCTKPFQFSCWNNRDPNRMSLLRSTINDPLFTLCHEVARKVTREEWPDLTKGSDHYYATSLPEEPYWAHGHKPNLRLGHHVFYQLNKGV